MDPKSVLFAKKYVRLKPDKRGFELNDNEDYVEDQDNFYARLLLAPPMKGNLSTVSFVDHTKKHAKKFERLKKQKETLEMNNQ